jgi:methylmalonyl-CoA mutase N-terminal domain/subunit
VQALAEQRKFVIGVNAFRSEEEPGIPILTMDPQGESRHLERLARVRAQRDRVAWRDSLDRLEAAARADENIMDALIAAVAALATIGEITDCLRGVFGEHRALLVV